MPIHKIPIVHKFGIVSNGHREELQERINQKYFQINTRTPPKTPKKFDYDIDGNFVTKYNSSLGSVNHKKYEESADKALQRLIRRAGIKSGGVGPHTNLPRAWCELSILAQCQGKIREDSLEVLITSLDQAPLNEDHISSLFYLAELSIYWLRQSAVSKPLLRTAEIKLMKMASLVFLRIYCFYCLKVDLSSYVKDLSGYIEGFDVCQEAYRAFPGSRMSLKFIADISAALIATYKDKIEENSENNDNITRESFMTAMHDISPSLWHSIDVWRCITHSTSGKQKALKALQVCAGSIATEPWVDIVLALQVIGDACRIDIDVLKLLHEMAVGSIPEDYIPIDEAIPYLNYHQDGLGSSEGATAQYSSQLSDSVDDDGAPSDMFASLGKMFTGTTTSDSQGDHRNRHDRIQSGGSSQIQSRSSANKSPTSYSHTTKTTEICDELDNSSQYGIKGWPWELGYVYAETLTLICLHGQTSDIQEMALFGNKHARSTDKSSDKHNYGLIDLLTFQYHDDEQMPEFARDRSWRIRAAAVQGLFKVCHKFNHDPSREGFYNVSWAALNQHKLKESDKRVLEAYKVGQFDADTDKKRLTIVPLHVSNTLVKHVAFLFSKTFLKELPPPVKIKRPPPKNQGRIYNIVQKPNITKPESNRLTLREHLLISSALYKPPMDFKTRSNINLNAVIEREWRKELHNQLDQEIDELQLNESQKKLQESESGKDYKEKTFPISGNDDSLEANNDITASNSNNDSSTSPSSKIKIIREYKKKDLELLNNLKTQLNIKDDKIVDLNRKYGNRLQHDQLIKVKIDKSLYEEAFSITSKADETKKLREVSATLPVLPNIKTSTASTDQS